MANRSLRKKTSALLLATALTASWASAAPRAGADFHANLFSRVWSYLVSLWAEEGCNIDPNGRHTTPTSDTGCNIDPNGRCTS